MVACISKSFASGWPLYRQRTSVKRIAVLLETHTDPETGYFHTTGSNQGSAPLDELLPVLFPQSLLDQLQKRERDNVNLILVACGSFWGQPQARQELKVFADK
jgi:hypothetical protein